MDTNIIAVVWILIVSHHKTASKKKVKLKSSKNGVPNIRPVNNVTNAAATGPIKCLRIIVIIYYVCEQCGLAAVQASSADSRSQARKTTEGGCQEDHPVLKRICPIQLCQRQSEEIPLMLEHILKALRSGTTVLTL